MLTDWGVKPMWAMTGMPASTMRRMLSATTRPPSSFTAWTPASFMNRTAVASACSGPAWYDPNGRSPTTSEDALARTTARANGSSSSTVTPTVSG